MKRPQSRKKSARQGGSKMPPSPINIKDITPAKIGALLPHFTLGSWFFIFTFVSVIFGAGVSVGRFSPNLLNSLSNSSSEQPNLSYQHNGQKQANTLQLKQLRDECFADLANKKIELASLPSSTSMTVGKAGAKPEPYLQKEIEVVNLEARCNDIEAQLINTYQTG